MGIFARLFLPKFKPVQLTPEQKAENAKRAQKFNEESEKRRAAFLKKQDEEYRAAGIDPEQVKKYHEFQRTRYPNRFPPLNRPPPPGFKFVPGLLPGNDLLVKGTVQKADPQPKQVTTPATPNAQPQPEVAKSTPQKVDAFEKQNNPAAAKTGA